MQAVTLTPGSAGSASHLLEAVVRDGLAAEWSHGKLAEKGLDLLYARDVVSQVVDGAETLSLGELWMINDGFRKH